MNHGKAAALLVLAALLAACDRGKSPQLPAAVPTKTPQTAGGAGKAASPRSSSRDLSSVDVCQLVPEALVAQMLNNELRLPATRQDMGPTQQGCTYWLGMAEKGTFEYVHIYLTSPESFEPLEAALKTDKDLGQDVTGEILTGLGDVAYAVHNKTTKDTSVHVLRRGDVCVEVKANTLAHARKLAETVLQRLGPR
jgi:hypothetical protein